MHLDEWGSRRLVVSRVLSEWCTEVNTLAAIRERMGDQADKAAAESFRDDLIHLRDKNAELRRHRQEREQITSYYEHGHTSPNPRTPHPRCPRRGPHGPHHFIAAVGIRRSIYCEGSPSTGH